MMKTTLLARLAILSSLIHLSPVLAQACTRHSPPHTVALLELYTSEGCSSCPPADRVLGNLRAGAGAGTVAPGADRLVPLALHVDYWDYIGWKDMFSSRVYTDRQRWLSKQAGSRTIYTPEMFIEGREMRNWADGIPAAVRRINSRPARADIGIALGKLGSEGLPVEVTATAAQNGRLFVALYENGLVSQINAGENKGVTLHHDYVVRQWIGPIALTGRSNVLRSDLTRTLVPPAGALASNLGVAAFVETDQGDILQALSLPVCGA